MCEGIMDHDDPRFSCDCHLFRDEEPNQEEEPMGTPTFNAKSLDALLESIVLLVRVRGELRTALFEIDDPDVRRDLHTISLAMEGSQRTINKFMTMGEVGE